MFSFKNEKGFIETGDQVNAEIIAAGDSLEGDEKTRRKGALVGFF